MSSQTNDQIKKNVTDGISTAQTAEGALEESTNTLQRMRDLAVHAKNGTDTTADQTATNAEFAQMSDELTRIART